MRNYQGEDINIIGKIMSALTDKYSKNFSPSKKKEFEKRVFEELGGMSELSAILLVLEEMRREGKADGGLVELLKL